MSVSRLHRLLRLVTELQGGTDQPAAELARELSVSRRTLFRDLTLLKESGIPCYHDRRGGSYKIATGFFLPPVNLQVGEAMGLMLLAQGAATQADQPMIRSAMEAVRKLMAMMPPAVREVCREMMGRVTLRPHSRGYVMRDADHYTLLQQAIDQKRSCRMTYQSLHDGGKIELTLRPYHLHYDVRSWYVIGFSEHHKQVRTFKLSRIAGLQLTKETFRRPASFHVDRYLGKAWRMIPEGKVHRVTLEFSPKMGRNVSEVQWHPTQKHELLADGRCRMEFEIDGLNEITWWLLGYGEHVRVIGPAALRRMMRQMHESAAKVHGAGQNGDRDGKVKR